MSEPLIEVMGLAMPSCETVVGTLMKGMFWLPELIFAESIIVPPPTPKKDLRLKEEVLNLAFSMVVMSLIVIAFYLQNIYLQAWGFLKKAAVVFFPANS